MTPDSTPGSDPPRPDTQALERVGGGPPAGGGPAPACPSAVLEADVFEASVDDALVARGWSPRFIADPLRRREAESLYEDLGFDVRSEPVASAGLEDVCKECYAAACPGYVMVYTRHRPEPAPPNREEHRRFGGGDRNEEI